MRIKYVDLFSGIGGTRLGLEQACKSLNIGYKCIFSSEIDIEACKTYQANFKEIPFGDIREISKIQPFDFLIAGFPCQPFSYAGKKRGFGDTRGTLFFEIEKILNKYRPKAFLLENVRGLTTHDNKKTFNTIINALENLNYGVKYLLLNSSNFGVPQNRVRIYILGLYKDTPITNLYSDIGATDSHNFKKKYRQKNLLGCNKFKVIKDILEEKVDKKYLCSPGFIKKLKEVVGEDLSKLAGYRLIDYRNGKSIHSWELGIKGKCTDEEIEFLNILIKNRRKKKFGSFKDGKQLTIDQIKTFYNNSNIEGIIDSLIKKGYLKSIDGKYNPVAGNMSFEVFKFLDPESVSITLVAGDAHKLGVVQNNIPRRITPREAARIQGFPDSFVLHPIDKYAYKQLGNSVSVPVIKDIIIDFFRNNKIT